MSERQPIRVTVLAATGATGRELVRQALERGHTVTAIARNKDRIPEADRLSRVSADVWDAPSIARAVRADTVVISALGVSKGARAGTLTAGAHALISTAPARILWLGALGTGASAQSVGLVARTVIGLALRADLPDKVAADTAVLEAGGTVFHAGPLSNAPISATRRTAPVNSMPRRLFPASVSRATVAAVMLDEAESMCTPGGIVVPLTR